MIDADFEAFEALWLSVNMECYEKTPSEEGMRIVFRALKKYPLEKIKIAIEQHLVDPEAGMFAPKAANIVKHIEGTQQDQAMRALTKALEAAEKYGRSVLSICFDDPVLQKSIHAFGGWSKFYDHFVHPNPNVHLHEKQFLSIYDRYKKYGDLNPPKFLQGALTFKDQENFERGNYETVFVGDKAQAKLISQRQTNDNVIQLLQLKQGAQA